jgi:hypothetical protein
LAKTAQNQANQSKLIQDALAQDEMRKLALAAKGAGLNAEAAERGKLLAYEPQGGEPNSIATSILSPKVQEARKIAEKARGEIATSPLSKSFADLKPNFDTMVKVYEYNDKPSTLAFVSSFARLLDPGSVVREGEIKNAENTQSFMQQLGYNLSSLVDGTQSLSPETKQQMVRAGAAKYNQFGADYTGNIERQRGIAGRYGVDPLEVIGDIDYKPFDFNDWATNATQSTLKEQLNNSGGVSKKNQLESILAEIQNPNLTAQQKAELTGRARMIAKGQ